MSKKVMMETVFSYFAISGFVFICMALFGVYLYDPTAGIETEIGRAYHEMYALLGELISYILLIAVFITLAVAGIRFVVWYLKVRLVSQKQVGN